MCRPAEEVTTWQTGVYSSSINKVNCIVQWMVGVGLFFRRGHWFVVVSFTTTLLTKQLTWKREPFSSGYVGWAHSWWMDVLIGQLCCSSLTHLAGKSCDVLLHKECYTHTQYTHILCVCVCARTYGFVCGFVFVYAWVCVAMFKSFYFIGCIIHTEYQA